MTGTGDRYSEMFKRQIVAEVESGRISAGAAQKKYGIRGHSTILRWRRKYGDAPPQGQLEEHEKTGVDQVSLLKREIKLLKQELDYSRMRTVAMETLVDIAEETYKIPIRKNSGAKQ